LTDLNVIVHVFCDYNLAIILIFAVLTHCYLSGTLRSLWSENNADEGVSYVNYLMRQNSHTRN